MPTNRLEWMALIAVAILCNLSFVILYVVTDGNPLGAYLDSSEAFFRFIVELLEELLP